MAADFLRIKPATEIAVDLFDNRADSQRAAVSSPASDNVIFQSSRMSLQLLPFDDIKRRLFECRRVFLHLPRGFIVAGGAVLRA